MHVLVPIARRAGFEQTHEFAGLLAKRLEERHPGVVTTEWLKEKRRGVFLDYHQNGAGRTIASVYSVRPKPGAPVSTPLRWDEVTEKLNPSIYSMDVVLDRVRRYGDVFEPVLTTRQSLTAALHSLR